MSQVQLDYICPQCRKRTVVSSHPEEGESIWCMKCEERGEQVAMQPHGKSSETAAAANAPTRSSNKAATATATATKKSSAKTTKAPKAAKPTKPPSKAAAAKAAAAAAALIPVPDFGDFRCACCGYCTTILPGASKSGPARCPSCFVKLDHIK